MISSYFDSKFGYNNQGELVFEPRDQHKGDASRAIFYMCTAYQSPTENWSLKPVISSSIPYNQDQDVLKKWNLILNSIWFWRSIWNWICIWNLIWDSILNWDWNSNFIGTRID